MGAVGLEADGSLGRSAIASRTFAAIVLIAYRLLGAVGFVVSFASFGGPSDLGIGRAC
jgi:hypothetical protein